MVEVWLWVIQRAVALLLIPLVFLHLSDKAGILGGWFTEDLRLVVTFLLLLGLLIHGLYGLRSTLYEILVRPELLRWIDRLLAALFVVLLVYGTIGWWIWFSR